MKKILYIIAMFIAISAVLSTTGCAEKAQNTGNEIQGASEHTTSTETSAATASMDSAAMRSTDSNSSREVDPVCKMKVDKSVMDTSAYKGKTYYFCSPYCKTEFDKNPEKYLNSQNST